MTCTPANCHSWMWLNPFTYSSVVRYPVPPPVSPPLSGRSLTKPNGLLADWKKKYRAISVSIHGFTRRT